MRIDAINSFMKPVRNTAAAAIIAVTPAAVKAESAASDLRPTAVTNTVNMTSWKALFGDALSSQGIYYGEGLAAKTNEMAKACNITKFTPLSNGKLRIGGIADGHVVTAQLLGSEKLGADANWKVLDFLENAAPYDGNSTTKWFLDIDSPKQKNYFFKWQLNPELGENDFGSLYQKLDANGKPIY